MKAIYYFFFRLWYCADLVRFSQNTIDSWEPLHLGKKVYLGYGGHHRYVGRGKFIRTWT